MSYTRFDDRNDGGAISEFRNRLANAVRAQTGKPFEIFQDIDGIGLGEIWANRLDEMLDRARFFIPTITPSYFTSAPCRQELEKFLQAEARRGRNDLVLPIYYIECDALEAPGRCATDPLAKAIHERQRWDWCELRYKSFESAEVRREIDRLAKAIAELLQPTFPCPEMVRIPAGRFMMGSPQGEHGRSSDEGPQHEVVFASPFELGRFPVTFEEYDHFCQQTQRELPDDEGWGRQRRPVIKVSWKDALAYIEWLSEETGDQYRLPSEAEWEYACRAGTTTPFSTGESISTDDANYKGDVSGQTGSYRKQTTPVGIFPVNPWGLFDMHGNVWEWVQDVWHENYTHAMSDGSPCLTGDDPNRRALRGASWFDVRTNLRAAKRYWRRPWEATNKIGFRVARSL